MKQLEAEFAAQVAISAPPKPKARAKVSKGEKAPEGGKKRKAAPVSTEKSKKAASGMAKISTYFQKK